MFLTTLDFYYYLNDMWPPPCLLMREACADLAHCFPFCKQGLQAVYVRKAIDEILEGPNKCAGKRPPSLVAEVYSFVFRQYDLEE